jgi:hypothetical protein
MDGKNTGSLGAREATDPVGARFDSHGQHAPPVAASAPIGQHLTIPEDRTNHRPAERLLTLVDAHSGMSGRSDRNAQVAFHDTTIRHFTPQCRHQLSRIALRLLRGGGCHLN